MALTFDRGTGNGQVEVDPVSRIEGHLGVKLTVASGYVSEADVHGNLWRGFENFLVGREVNDAITFVQRICGVCPVPHGQTSTFAVDAVLGYNDNFTTFVAGMSGSPTGSAGATNGGDDRVAVGVGKGVPLKAVLIRNLVLSQEFLMSHITHSYHLAAPSYIQGPNIPPWTPYFHNSFYHPLMKSTGNGVSATTNASNTDAGHQGSTLPVLDDGFSKDLWSAVIKSYVHALRIRRLTFEAGALFAGRMPMTSCYVGGGVTTDKNEDLTVKCTKYRQITEEVGQFVVREFIPIFLALGVLYPNYDNTYNAQWLSTNASGLWDMGNQGAAGPYGAGKAGWGGGVGNYLAWGGFPQSNGYLALRRGYMLGAASATQSITSASVLANLREHIKYSRYQGSTATVDANGNPVLTTGATITDPATEARTVPERNDAAKYSWLKAPRWSGNPMEVGPMARMFVGRYFQDNQPLASTIGAYGLYTKASGAVSGLDPAMISADVAVACVRAGVANLTLVDYPTAGTNTVVDAAFLAGLAGTEAANKQAIVDAYNYAGAVITGPLALWVVNLKAGKSTIDRLRARPLESLILVLSMIGSFSKPATATSNLVWAGSGGWIGELAATSPGDATYIQKTAPVGETFGFGGTEAPRGALMHMCTQVNGKIKKYQCIVPTTWNAAPKDANDARGPMEQAMIAVPYSVQTTAAKGGAGAAITGGGGVEALRVAQSFDPCIACAVH